MEIEYATKRLIDSIWTVGFVREGDGAKVLFFGREEPKGYELEKDKSIPFFVFEERTVDGQKRTVTDIVLKKEDFGHGPDNILETLKVTNPQYVFDYPETEAEALK